MRTIKLYQQDVYLREATACVTAVEEAKGGCRVCLTQTIFFPEGGGQSCDKGTLAGHAVLDVQERDGQVWHLVDCQIQDLPAPGSPVEVSLCLDWAHRFDNMQRHCGEHITSGIFFREYGGVNRGFHMGEQYMTIDISLEEKPEFTEITWEMAKHVELCANQVIWANAPVITRRFATREEAAGLPLRKALAIDEDISIVCVGSVDEPADCVACCGTHPATAEQVGLIKILKVESNKGMFRIYLEAGERAFRLCQQHYDTLLSLGHKLSAGPEDILSKYDAQQDKNNVARSQLGALRREVIAREAASLRAVMRGDSAAGAASSSADSPHGAKQASGQQPSGTMPPESSNASSISDVQTRSGARLSAGNFVRYYDVLTLDDLLNLAKALFDAIPGVLFLVHRPSHTVLLCSGGKPDCGKLVKENAAIYGGKGGGNANSARAIFTSEDYVDTFIDLIDKHLR